MKAERILYEAHPSMFRNRPVSFVLVLLLCLVGVGLIILLIWWLQCLGTTLIVSTERTTMRRGILSKSISEVWHKDVRNVQLYQSFFQRIFGVGRIGISSSGQSGVEIEAYGLPSPDKVKRLIDEHRRGAA